LAAAPGIRLANSEIRKHGSRLIWIAIDRLAMNAS